MKLDCDRLPVYRDALVFRAIAERIASASPRGQSDLSSQLRSAANSIVLNICEGAGEFAPLEKVRIYRLARRSAAECVGIVDVYLILEAIDAAAHAEARMSLAQIIAQLVLLMTRIEATNPHVHEGRKAERQRGREAERQKGRQAEAVS